MLNVLLSCSFENVRSFKERADFTLLATRRTEPDVARTVPVAPDDSSIRVLPGAGVFGANASGKSTLLKALADMRSLVLSSFRVGTTGSGIARRPFLLDERMKHRPSLFSVELVLDNVRWQYGFALDDQRVVDEYAYHFPNGRQALVFERDHDGARFGAAFRTSGRSLETLVRDNSLLLSVSGAAADNPLAAMFHWFQRNLRLAEVSTRGLRAAQTADLLADPDQSTRVLQLLRAADLGLDGIDRRQPDSEMVERIGHAVRILNGEELEPESPSSEIRVDDFLEFRHASASGPVTFDAGDESQGTLVWVGLIGPILDALDGGHVLLADELDASLHPHLVRHLIDLFQRCDTNPRGAQLIFNAHDVTALGGSDDRAIGRDQIWFTEKDRAGATTLYPLSDFAPRKDEALERRYLQGRFGAVPELSYAEFERAVAPQKA